MLFQLKYPAEAAKEIAKKEKEVRKPQKMTQSELSRRAEVSLGSLKRFEQTGEISFVSLLKTADVLGELPAFEELFERQVDQSIEEVIDERNRKNKSKIEEIVDTERKDIIDSYR